MTLSTPASRSAAVNCRLSLAALKTGGTSKSCVFGGRPHRQTPHTHTHTHTLKWEVVQAMPLRGRWRISRFQKSFFFSKWCRSAAGLSCDFAKAIHQPEMSGCLTPNDANFWKRKGRNVRKKKDGRWRHLRRSVEHNHWPLQHVLHTTCRQQPQCGRSLLLMNCSRTAGVVRSNRPVRCWFRRSVWTLYHVGRQERHFAESLPSCFSKTCRPPFYHLRLLHLFHNLFMIFFLFFFQWLGCFIFQSKWASTFLTTSHRGTGSLSQRSIPNHLKPYTLNVRDQKSIFSTE